MTKEPVLCPLCYTNVTKVNKRPDGNKQCPKCKVILNCNKSCSNVRCPKCQRLFSDTLTYLDHLDKFNECNYIRPELVIV